MTKHSGFCSAHRDGEDEGCRICYPDDITQEDAVKVAEFLGGHKLSEQGMKELIDDEHENWSEGDEIWDFEGRYGPFHYCTLEDFKTWIMDSKGQSAIMDRLEELAVEKSPDFEFEIGFISWSLFAPAPCWVVWIGKEGGVPETQIAKAYHKTRQLALIKAVLEMLKGGE